jgi:RecA-family ATPase
MQIQDLLSHLSGVKKSSAGWQACCPSHDDKTASLAVSKGEKGILLNCFAGCKNKDIVETMGLKMSDLFYDDKPVKAKEIVYDYVNEKGRLMYQVVRKPGKNFPQRRPDGADGWIYNLKGVAKTIYRLPEVVRADTVYIVEGEKDVETLERIGLTATCNSGGANKGNWKEKFGSYLRGKSVIILPDSDRPGRRHANAIAAKLAGVAKSLKLIELPDLKDGEDVSDWLPRNSKEELLIIVKDAPEFTSDKTVGAKTIRACDIEPVPTEWIIDGMLPVNVCVLCQGEEKSAKSWILFMASICIANKVPLFGNKVIRDGPVVIYSPESNANSRSRRLFGLCWYLEMEPKEALKNVILVTERLDLSEEEYLIRMRKTIEKEKPSLFIIDPLITAHIGLNENSSSEMQPLFNSIRDLTQSNPGMSVIVSHHNNKDYGNKSQWHGSRGTSALGAWADGRWTIKKENPNNQYSKRLVDIEHRDDGSATPFAFYIKQHCVLNRFNVKAGLFAYDLEQCAMPEPKSTKKARTKKAEFAAILDLLRVHNGKFTRIQLAQTAKKLSLELFGAVSQRTIENRIRELIFDNVINEVTPGKQGTMLAVNETGKQGKT